MENNNQIQIGKILVTKQRLSDTKHHSKSVE